MNRKKEALAAFAGGLFGICYGIFKALVRYGTGKRGFEELFINGRHNWAIGYLIMGFVLMLSSIYIGFGNSKNNTKTVVVGTKEVNVTEYRIEENNIYINNVKYEGKFICELGIISNIVQFNYHGIVIYFTTNSEKYADKLFVEIKRVIRKR